MHVHRGAGPNLRYPHSTSVECEGVACCVRKGPQNQMHSLASSLVCQCDNSAPEKDWRSRRQALDARPARAGHAHQQLSDYSRDSAEQGTRTSNSTTTVVTAEQGARTSNSTTTVESPSLFSAGVLWRSLSGSLQQLHIRNCQVCTMYSVISESIFSNNVKCVSRMRSPRTEGQAYVSLRQARMPRATGGAHL
jgi:hypothetical protein